MPVAETHHLAELTIELVASYVARNAVPAADLPVLIATLHDTLSGLGHAPEREHPVAKPTPAVPIRKSITDTHIISLEDGKPYQALKRHLTRLGMTPADYRAKWGLPHDYPMVAAAYSRNRSALAKEMGLGSMRRKR